MSIPPLLSRSPPPICETSDDEDDFGNFVVNSELALDVCQAPDILDEYEKKMGMKCEDTTSEDSGLCMSSLCQTQSPCDSSPLSSSCIHSSSVENTHLSENNEFFFSNPENRISENVSLPLCSQDSLINGLQKRPDREKIKNTPIGLSVSLRNSSVENGVLEPILICGENLSTLVERNDTDLNKTEIRVNTLVNDLTEEEYSHDIKSEDTIVHSNTSCTVNNSQECYKYKTSDRDIRYDSDFESFNQNEDLSIDITGRNIIPDVLSSAKNITTHDYQLLMEKVEDNLKPSSANELRSQIKEHSTLDTLASFENDFEIADEEFSDFQSNLCTASLSCELTYTKKDQIKDLWMDWSPKIELNPSLLIPLDEELDSSKVWFHLCSFDNSPALSYQWASSTSNCKLLSALKIDSRNILFGPWNKFKFSPTEGIPVLDSWKNIGLKEKTKETDIMMPKDPVPDAHFDWVGSGLINPLDSSCNQRGSGNDIHSINIPKMSRKACEVMQTLPDLSFMRKPFIVFPKCAV